MKNMKHNKPMRETRIIPRAMTPLANGEAAQCGEAECALNVREREQALQVTGQPARVGQMAAGDRLLTIAGAHLVTCRGRQVMFDGGHAVTVTGDIVGAHVIGPMIVVVTTQGLTYLLLEGDSWQVMNPDDAVPGVTFSTDVNTVSADIEAVDFAEPYSQWRAPLADADTTTFASMLRTAWNAMNSDARAEGYRTAPVLARWAVRLVDGSYLWASDPVRVGDETLANADRVTAQVNTSSSGFTGTQATTMPLKRYLLDITLTSRIPDAWQPLVAAIDVFVTDEAQLLAASRSLDYRCLTRTVGPREYVLEMGLSRRSATAIDRQLASSPWHLIATAPATAQIGSQDFTSPVEDVTLTTSQCAALATPMRLVDVLCSVAAGGRLYCCTAGGDVVVSAPGNALIEACRRAVLGVVPMAMAVVTTPLYSGGFGRYPVYVFSDDGVYAVPQGAMGKLGEARLVDRTVIAAGVPPIEAGRDVWFISRHGHLCRLNGSRLTVCLREAGYRALAWCNAHSELWLLPSAGNPLVLLPSGRMSERTVSAVNLYSDPRHAVAITATGDILDLEQEQAALMPVSWRTHPVALHPLMGEAVHRVVWHLTTTASVLTLKVIGQRGVMAQDIDVSVMNVSGAADQPLAAPTMAWQCRTLRLDVSGTACSGTLLLPALIYSRKC